jgi:hypothetical protein
MKLKTSIIAVLAAIPGLAFAVAESEPNHPIGLAQSLTVASDGSVTVEGVVGNLAGPPVLDTDYYTFEGTAGDVVTFDIDGGWGGTRNVDTMLGVFGPGPSYTVLRFNDDGPSPLDPGSTRSLDSRVVNFVLPATGAYTVGISSYPRRFANGGGTTSNALNSLSNGDYTLIISGVTPQLLQISIDIKPGNGDELAPLNPKARGKIPVALLGSAEFDVRDVETGSLTFGHSGSEASLHKCGEPSDVNGDLWADLVCHFENQEAKFVATDDEAILKGELDDGRAFEGRGWLKMVPAKAQ